MDVNDQPGHKVVFRQQIPPARRSRRRVDPGHSQLTSIFWLYNDLLEHLIVRAQLSLSGRIPVELENVGDDIQILRVGQTSSGAERHARSHQRE